MTLPRLIKTCLNIVTPPYFYKNQPVNFYDVITLVTAPALAFGVFIEWTSNTYAPSIFIIKITALISIIFALYLRRSNTDIKFAKVLSIVTIVSLPLAVVFIRDGFNYNSLSLLLLWAVSLLLIDNMISLARSAVAASASVTFGLLVFIKIYLDLPGDNFLQPLVILLILVVFWSLYFYLRRIEGVSAKEDKIIQANTEYNQVNVVSSWLPYGVIRLDREGLCVHVSDRWSEITARDFDQSLGGGWLEVFYPEKKETIITNHLSEEKDEIESCEYKISVFGEVRFVKFNCASQFDENDVVTGFIGTLEDITKRKLDETRFVQQALLIENLHSAIVLLDLEGQILFINKAAKDISGWKEGDVFGDPVESKEEYRDRLTKLDRVLSIVLKHGVWSGEFRYKKNGAVTVLQVTLTAIGKDINYPLNVLGVVKDITEIEHIKQRERLRTVMVNGINDAIILISPNASIISWNSGAEKLLGWKESEVVGSNLCRLISIPEDVAKFHRNIKKATDNNDWHGDVLCIKKNKSPLEVSVNIKYLKEESLISDTAGQIVVTLTDNSVYRITERDLKQRLVELEELVGTGHHELLIKEKELQQANLERIKFMSDVSRKLSVPLVAVKNNLDSFSATGHNDSKALDSIALEIQRITKILTESMSESFDPTKERSYEEDNSKSTGNTGV